MAATRLRDAVALPVARPGRTACVVAAATVAAALALPGLRVDASVARLTRPDAPGADALQAAREVFGSDDVLVVAQIGEGPAVTPERLGRLRALSESIARVDGVVRVWSLTETGHVRADDEGIDVRDLLDDLPADPDARGRRAREIVASPLYREHLVSADGRTAAVVVFPEVAPEDPFLQDRVVAGVRRAMADHAGPERLVLTGNPAFTVDVAATMEREQGRFTAASLVVLGAMLGGFFRSGRAVAAVLAAAGLATVWVLGGLAALGGSMSVLSTIVPSLLLAVAVSYAVHVVHRYRSAAGGPRERARSAVRAVAPATLLSALTTMAGFAALSANRIDAIREFGWIATAAVAAAAVAVLVGVPTALAALRTRIPAPSPHGAAPRIVAHLERLALSRGGAIRLGGLALAGAAALGAARLEVDTAFVDYLRADHPANVARREVLRHLAGPIPLRVVLDAGRRDGVLDPDVLARVERLQRHLETLPHVQATWSLVDLLSDMNRAWHADSGDSEDRRRPPGSPELAAQYLLLYESSRFAHDLERLVSFERDRMAVWVRTDLYRSSEAEATLAAVDAYLDRELADLSPAVSGTLAMLFRSADEISVGQARSLLLALAAIGTVVLLAFRSLRLGLVAAVPNLLPVLLLFGAMGAFGVTLNVGTCVVACLCLGVAADDTIHFVSAWREARSAGADPRAAVRTAFGRVGVPILQTSAALAVGFGVLAFSSFRPIAELGALTALTMVACVVGDLLLLPALLDRHGGPSEARKEGASVARPHGASSSAGTWITRAGLSPMGMPAGPSARTTQT